MPGQSRYAAQSGAVTASGYQAGQAVTAGTTKTTVPNTIADVIVATSLISVLVATLLTQYRVRR